MLAETELSPQEVAPKIGTLRPGLVPIAKLVTKGKATPQQISRSCKVTIGSAQVYLSQLRTHLGFPRTMPIEQCGAIIAEAMKLPRSQENGHGSAGNGRSRANRRVQLNDNSRSSGFLALSGPFLSTTELELLSAFGKSLGGGTMSKIIHRAVKQSSYMLDLAETVQHKILTAHRTHA